MRQRKWNKSTIFGEPQDEVYKLTKTGTLALLQAVDKADTTGAQAKASKSNPCDAVTAYLDTSFLGPFLRSGKQIPFMHNAGVLGTYIEFLDSELERGAIHATPRHQTFLKLLAYVTAIEASAPLAVYGNCLEFLASRRKPFDFDIYGNTHSASKKLEAVSSAMKNVSDVPQPFRDLHNRLQTLFDRVYRNAIAHSTYRVRSADEKVDIWDKGRLETTVSFNQVDERYRYADSYLRGFTRAVGDFADAIHPDCPYAWNPGAKY